MQSLRIEKDPGPALVPECWGSRPIHRMSTMKFDVRRARPKLWQLRSRELMQPCTLVSVWWTSRNLCCTSPMTWDMRICYDPSSRWWSPPSAVHRSAYPSETMIEMTSKPSDRDTGDPDVACRAWVVACELLRWRIASPGESYDGHRSNTFCVAIEVWSKEDQQSPLPTPGWGWCENKNLKLCRE